MEYLGGVHFVVTTGCGISTEILALRVRTITFSSNRIPRTTNCVGIAAVAEKKVALSSRWDTILVPCPIDIRIFRGLLDKSELYTVRS